MNNKLITFALLNLTASATEAASDCVDDITNQYKAAKAMAEADAAKLEEDRVALAAIRDAENSTYLEYKGDSDTALTDTTAFIAKMEERQGAWQVEEDKRLEAVANIAAGASELAALLQAKETATGNVGTSTTALTTANTELTAQEANVVTHTTEKAAFVAVFDAATEDLALKTTAFNDATQAWEVATENKTGCQPAADGTYDYVTHPCKTYSGDYTTPSDRAADTVQGTQRTAAIALADKNTADGHVTTALDYTDSDSSTTKKVTGASNTDEASWALDLRSANIDLIKKTAEKAQYDAAKDAAKFDTTNAGDGAEEVKVTSLTTEENAANAANTIWEAAMLAHQTKVSLAGIAAKLSTLRASEDSDQDGVIAGLLSTKNTKSGEKDTSSSTLLGTPTTDKDKAVVHYDNAVIERDNAIAIRDAAADKLRADQDAEFVATYLWQAKEDIKVAEAAKQAAAEAELENLLALKTTAEDTGTRAKARHDFYLGFTTTAKAALDATDLALDAIVQAKEEADGRATAAQASFEDAVEVCKHRRYAEAMEALNAATTRAEQAATASADLKTQYDKDASRGTSCFKDAEGVRADPCEGEEACCGQANKYDRDGTRRTIEVCGTRTQRSYTFWPEFVTGMEKAPETEEWRYYCLDGARFLSGAAATFALAVFMQ